MKFVTNINIDKENLIKFLLDFVYYLYIFLTLTLLYYLVLPYNSLLSHMSKN